METKRPIIVIDDDLDEQFLYQRAFEKMNISNEVVYFDNGVDAFEYLKQPAADPLIILSDINMPGMNGFELREMICNDEGLSKKNTPFVFMSTSSSPADIERAKDLFSQGFFIKELSVSKYEQNLAAIVAYWNNSSWISN